MASACLHSPSWERTSADESTHRPQSPANRPPGRPRQTAHRLVPEHRILGCNYQDLVLWPDVSIRWARRTSQRELFARETGQDSPEA